jgi:hypothetical protein
MKWNNMGELINLVMQGHHKMELQVNHKKMKHKMAWGVRNSLETIVVVICNNAKSCKMAIMLSTTLAKNQDEGEQHGRAHKTTINFFMKNIIPPNLTPCSLLTIAPFSLLFFPLYLSN